MTAKTAIVMTKSRLKAGVKTKWRLIRRGGRMKRDPTKKHWNAKISDTFGRRPEKEKTGGKRGTSK